MLHAKHEAEKKNYPNVRFDRIILNGKEIYDILDCRIVGNKQLEEKDFVEDEVKDARYGDKVFISDHFGLVCKFKKK